MSDTAFFYGSGRGTVFCVAPSRILLSIVCLYLGVKKIPRTAQSIVMAIHTPNAPRPKNRAITKLAPTLNTHIENADTSIGYITSFAARRAFGSANENDQNVHAHMV